MPRVPLPQEQLNPGATPQFTAGRVVPFQNPAGFQIQQFGRALQSAGEATANIADVLQDDMDNARTKEAYTLWNDHIQQTLHDPDQGYLNAVGKDATGSRRTQANSTIETKAQEILGQLDNPTQKGMFQDLINRRMVAVNTQMNQHQSRQAHVFNIGESKAMAESAAGDSIEATLLAFGQGDAELSAEAIRQRNTAIEQARVVARGLGFGEAQTEAMVLETTTQIHAGVMQRLISEGRSGEASAYLQSVDPKEIAPEERARMQGVVKRATLGDQAQDKAASIIEKADKAAQKALPEDEAGQPLTSDQLRKAAFNILDKQKMPDDLRQMTIQRIEQQIKRRAANEAADDRDLFIEAQTMLAQDPTMGVTQLPAEMQLDLQERGLWTSINQFARSGRKSDNPQAHARIMDAPNEAFLGITSPGELHLALLKEGASPQTIQLALARWNEARGANTPADDDLLSPARRLRNTAIRNGLLPQPGRGSKPATDEQEALFTAITEEANRRQNEAQRAAGGDIRGEALQEIYDGVIADLVYSGGELAVRGTLNAEELAEAEVEVDGTLVPVLVEETIRLELQRLGEPADPRDILKRWRQLGKPDTPGGVRGASGFSIAPTVDVIGRLR